MRRLFPFFILALAIAAAGCREDGIQISSLDFNGVEQVDKDALASALQTRRGSRIPWGRQRYFDRRAFDADLKRIQAFYADRGFPDARVTSFDVELNDAQDTVDIAVNISEGEPIWVAAVELAGFDVLTADELEHLQQSLLLRVDAPLDRTVARAARERALNELRDRGYPHAEVTVAEEEAGEKQRRVIFEATPGPLAHFGPIEIEGEVSVNENIIRRQLTFEPGDVFSRREMRESQRMLYGLELFEFVNVQSQEDQAPQMPEVPVRVTVAEGKHQRVTFGVGYGSHGALELSSTFNIAMPNLTPEDATIQAKSEATFVEIAGQGINELSADTTYAKGRLEFNAVAQEGPRELAVQGVSVLYPDHQEIHLANLVLRTEQVEWRSAPGTGAAIRYGDDHLTVEHVTLVSGDQRIEADGVIGSSTDVLRVRAQNVDVSQLDQLLLTNQEIAGRLDANAVVSGPVSDPRVEGEFALRKGAFRTFTFEAFTGKLDYVGRGMKIDVRLDQSSQAWLTAAGYAPLSLFRPNPEGVTGHDAPGVGEAVDIQIASSQIDLGVIQGFTTYVTDVTGALQANVKVTGTGHDPHFDGTIDIRGGTFAIPNLGTAYTGLDTRIDLKTDALTISEMRIVDQHQQVMTVGGTLAVHEREVGAVDVRVQSENFEVIDNPFADLKLDADVRVTGELRKPRVEGFVEVESGTIDVSRVLEQATADPYATEATPFETTPPVPDAVPLQTSILDALELNVGIAVPSNLVLRGTDMRPVNAPIDMGDLNVTVGGAVLVQKAPGGKPRLTGEVNTVRGSYTFQGRRFDIMRDGRVRFAGEEDIDPVFDFRARRIISGVETFVRVQGTLRQPELTFSSNPPLDQADILSLIVFNLPINELGEGQQVSLAERAGALAGGYLASGLTRSIANALELDEFEIQAQGDYGAGPSLSIGEQVGERLFVRVRQGFGAAEATELILEYQIADFLRLQGAVAETSNGTQRVTFRRVERGGVDLIFFFSY